MVTIDPAARVEMVVARWLVVDHDARGLADGILARNGCVPPARRQDIAALFNRVAAAAQEVAAAVEASP
jgi:hypothetical protein